VNQQEDMARIRAALERASAVLARFHAGTVDVQWKSPGDPVTEADRAVNEALLEILPRPGEGWLSEETADDPDRLRRERVWIVDPIDGTREFVEGLDQWCVSVGLVENGVPVAGGVLNHARGELFLGARGAGVWLNGTRVRFKGNGPRKPRRVRPVAGHAGGRADPQAIGPAPGLPDPPETLDGAVILVSRTEWNRGEWKRFEGAPFSMRPIGSVAYKLALLAAGEADASWTDVPKHEWDLAGGAALVESAGGIVRSLSGEPVTFNKPDLLVPDLVTCRPTMLQEILAFLGRTPSC
jgi:myo-inositol-1(or 4)-monophosphatase